MNRKPKKIHIFQAYVSYNKNQKRKIYTIENCISVKGRIAHLYRWRIRPIFANLNSKEEVYLFNESRRHRFTLTAENHTIFYPYRVELRMEGMVKGLNFDEPHG
ncbi:MAG: hypothetical protein ACI9DJ_002498 [Algoriphagus sp.]|jgi:hypothetical protein